MTSAATTGISQTAVIFSMLWFCCVNIRNGISTPQATAMIMSIHHSASAMSTAARPQCGMPNARKPLMIVASPIGMAPKNMDTTEWPKIRLASCGKTAQRAGV